jgi:methyl halide transferase
MMKMNLNKNYWENRYQNKETGWDTGSITTPIKAFIDGLENKNTSILIPGAGNGYEFEYLIQNGFTNVDVLDFASAPLDNIRKRMPDCNPKHLIQSDFFEHMGQYDLIIEQTFFCAISPELRPNYVQHMLSLLKPGGTLAGLFFNFPLTENGPPFGGDKETYIQLFSPYFEIKKLEPAYNSIKPREGKELFFNFEKKTTP